jgi:quercetin 2,3-dioxygenase
MSTQIRAVKQIVTPMATSDGAGVKLARSIGTPTLDYLDPFLLLDEFRSDNPNDYIAGFPDHPHRGIETVSYMIHGRMEHRDSIGNSGIIGPGDTQWMTSGRGIIHAEMPKRQPDGRLWGYQLWINIPEKQKMDPPRYQDITAEQIPTVTRDDGTVIRVITGQFDGTAGPVNPVTAEPSYYDVDVPAGVTFTAPVKPGHTVFAYVLDGKGAFGPEDSEQLVESPRLVIFSDGDEVRAKASDARMRFLLVSGKPFGEPIARYGPFVMTTREQIDRTIADLRNGTFLDPDWTT